MGSLLATTVQPSRVAKALISTGLAQQEDQMLVNTVVATVVGLVLVIGAVA